MRVSRVLPLLAVLMAAIVAACGGAPAGATGTAGAGTQAPLSTTPAAATGAPDKTEEPVATNAATAGTGDGGAFCALITKEEMQAVVGAEVTEQDSTAAGCTYEFRGGMGGAVDIRTDPTDDLDTLKTVFPGGQDVPGLGDRAYWAPTVSVLGIIKGGRSLTVQLIIIPKPADPLGVATKIAQIALPRY